MNSVFDFSINRFLPCKVHLNGSVVLIMVVDCIVNIHLHMVNIIHSICKSLIEASLFTIDSI
jgi:hypothetical protein